VQLVQVWWLPQESKGFIRLLRTSFIESIALTVAVVTTGEPLVITASKYTIVKPKARLLISMQVITQPIAINRLMLEYPIKHSNSDNSFGQ
jgi:hypothetical protein